MKKPVFIIVSLKHTRKTDDYFTLWGENSRGYTMNEERAGKYSEDDAVSSSDYFSNGVNTLAVNAKTIEDAWARVQENGIWFECLPNNREIRKLLGIKLKQLK